MFLPVIFLTVMLWKHGLTKTCSDAGRFVCGTYCFMYGCALAAPSQIIDYRFAELFRKNPVMQYCNKLSVAQLCELIYRKYSLCERCELMRQLLARASFRFRHVWWGGDGVLVTIGGTNEPEHPVI